MKQKYSKTKILTPNKRNVRSYTILDESIYLKVSNAPKGEK